MSVEDDVRGLQGLARAAHASSAALSTLSAACERSAYGLRLARARLEHSGQPEADFRVSKAPHGEFAVALCEICPWMTYERGPDCKEHVRALARLHPCKSQP